ncbi:hypothetical protein AB0H42_33085 [Nocardia sp. NPDC050799]|uniref:hypothetical protein n=1 Tax=Nocardia sp. NPDC050799 TaxID=3154842 RepID=UPI0033F9B94C
MDEYIDAQPANDVLFANWNHPLGLPSQELQGKNWTMTQSTQQINAHDEAQIRAVILGYVGALDGRRFEHIANAFTGTAELENTFESYIPEGEAFTGVLARGAQSIAESVGGLMGRLDATQHFLGRSGSTPPTRGCAHADTGYRAPPPRHGLGRVS